MRVVAFKTNHDDITARRPFQKNPSPFQGEGRERVCVLSTIRVSLHESPTEGKSPIGPSSVRLTLPKPLPEREGDSLGTRVRQLPNRIFIKTPLPFRERAG